MTMMEVLDYIHLITNISTTFIKYNLYKKLLSLCLCKKATQRQKNLPFYLPFHIFVKNRQICIFI